MRLTARIATIELAETFVISRSAQDTADVVYVEVEHEGVTGYGEATPIEHYGQSAESALAPCAPLVTGSRPPLDPLILWRPAA